ncbi:uroporphyrinogen decarboxylase [Bifidobacterium sp. UTCIF-39]|uniref:uroporphyrinogen decarboxylase family protein n=1 Tax=Bifidobacterium sp. UTCIF-39 TaxID=1465359 RepID=UPI00112AA50A|nr:uroporphyrinogen decarboxylase family protein [Bifidobacterium sp. UTCIF-39]TPF96282.1 uroporphyrinogen decarboxylase [Bifidobacterium sp. UTCIF-39]
MTDRRAVFHDIVKGTATVPYLTAAWQHLVGHEYGAEEFAAAYVDFVKTWDWDWVKINPRAVYYSEAWGSTYDRNRYDGFVLPKKLTNGIDVPDDIEKVTRLDVHESAPFAEHIKGATLIREQLQDRAVLQTVFSPLSALLQIADLPLYPGDEYATPNTTVKELILDQPERAKKALNNIALTLADYATALVTPADQGGAGVDGVFYAVTGTVSEGYFSKAQYEEFSKPYDRIVIDAIRKANPDAAILLHTCRAESHPDWFDDLGVDLIHWDQYLPGNPKIDADLKAVPVGGANVLLFNVDGDPEAVERELDETIALRDGKPFLLAPSCTVFTPAGEDALKALAAHRAV